MIKTFGLFQKKGRLYFEESLALGKLANMNRSKRYLVLGTLVAFTAFGMAMVQPPAEEGFKNLKVLPKNISKEDLDKIMHSFNDGLGVKCNFCHANVAGEDRKLDFPSDAKPEKDIARKMLKMTAKINKKFFGYDVKKENEAAPPVMCATCHHGQPHPSDAIPKKEPRGQRN